MVDEPVLPAGREVAEHARAVDDAVVLLEPADERPLRVGDVERHLVGEQLFALRGRRDGRLTLPRGGHPRAQVLGLERCEPVVNPVQRLGPRDRSHEDVAGGRSVPRHVALSDETAKAPAHHDGIDQPQSLDERLDVVRHPRDRPERRIAAIRTAVSAMVDREDPVAVVDKGIEPREPHGAVEARAAVERDERAPLPLLVHVELDIADVDAHLRRLPHARPQ